MVIFNNAVRVRLDSVVSMICKSLILGLIEDPTLPREIAARKSDFSLSILFVYTFIHTKSGEVMTYA